MNAILAILEHYGIETLDLCVIGGLTCFSVAKGQVKRVDLVFEAVNIEVMKASDSKHIFVYCCIGDLHHE